MVPAWRACRLSHGCRAKASSAGLAAVPKVLQWEAALLQEVTEQ